MARVGHLIRRKQQEVERIARILRTSFDPTRVQAPEPGQIRRIILIGPYARRNWYEDDQTIHFSDYEFWIVVGHPLFKEQCCWSRAPDVLDRKSVVQGKSVSVRVDLGGPRIIKKKN